MSIYYHFPSKAHLFEALVDRVIGALAIPPASLPWRKRMQIAMEDFRAAGTCASRLHALSCDLSHELANLPGLARRHPGLVQ